LPTQLHTTTAGRLAAAVAVLAVLLLVVGAGPAHAAGTGGIEVVPDPAVVDGKEVSRFDVEVPSRGEEQERFVVRNVDSEPRTARLYTAQVRRVEGDLQLGDAGSSAFAVLPAEDVVLQPGEAQSRAFIVRGGDLPGGEQMAAVVVEVGTGSVVQRASTMIYLEAGRQVPLPLLLVVAAVVLVMAAGAAVAVLARRRSTQPSAQ
jgi:hypothetical protein